MCRHPLLYVSAMGSVELSFLQIRNPDFCLVRMPRASISIFLSTFDIGRARRGLIEASSATKIIAGRACSDLMNVEMAWLAMIVEKGHAGFYHIGYIIECMYMFIQDLTLLRQNKYYKTFIVVINEKFTSKCKKEE